MVIRRRRLHRPPFGRNVARSQIIPHGPFLACFGHEVAFPEEMEWKARSVVILLLFLTVFVESPLTRPQTTYRTTSAFTISLLQKILRAEHTALLKASVDASSGAIPISFMPTTSLD